MDFSERLDQEIQRAGLTRKELASRLGIPVGTISMWKSRGNLPRADVVARIAKILGSSADYLVNGAGPMSPEESAKHAGAFDGDVVAEPSGRYEYPIPVERWVKRQESLMADLMELSDSELGTIAMMVRPLANQARESRKETSAG